MPVCGIEDDIMSPVREEEEGEDTNGIDVLNVNNNKNNMNIVIVYQPPILHPCPRRRLISQKLKGPQSPLPNSNTGATTVNTAFSYIDAMRSNVAPKK